MFFNETNDKESVAIEEQVGFDKQDEWTLGTLKIVFHFNYIM